MRRSELELENIRLRQENERLRASLLSDDERVAIDLILADLDRHGVIMRVAELNALIPVMTRQIIIVEFAQMLRDRRATCDE